MALVFVSEKAESEARRHGVYDELKRLKQECEERSLDDAIALFDNHHPYKKRRVRNFRWIAKPIEIEEIRLIAILALLSKGSREYEQFKNNPRGYGQDHFEQQIDPERNLSFRRFLDQIKSEERACNEEKKPELPDNLQRWLERFEIVGHSSYVMESPAWVQRMEDERYYHYWLSYYELVCTAARSGQVSDRIVPKSLSSSSKISKYMKGEQAIYIAEFGYLEGPQGKDLITITYIIDAIDKRYCDAIEKFETQLAQEYAWVDGKEMVEHPDEIARHAKRSYPTDILSSSELWSAIQKSQRANLALSGEEALLLNRLRSDEESLPVFINGRAGSGKSTMLYYLFADYLYRKQGHPDLAGDLLFLTYSEALSETARDTVRDLLRARADIALDRATSADNGLQGLPDYGDCFQPFRSYLIELAVQNGNHNFQTDREIDFRLFTRLYSGNSVPRYMAAWTFRGVPRYSADLCWHVIRTFIKGYSSDGFLTPEEYEDLPRDEKSVSDQTYRIIYQQVWDRWYRDLYEQYGLWDSQDLVRCAIEQKWAEPKYAVLFCDEAQDFTRLEFEFIRSLLIYREYDLGFRPCRLPFSLAGDPFQTLNPTGFRWEGIKAAFYDEIVQNLDPYNRGVISAHHEELSLNYRSADPIVKFGNLLQLWRAVLFDLSVRPQQPWLGANNSIPPQLLILDETISPQEFKELIQDAIVIVPTDYNGENNFIDEDDLLRSIKNDDSTFSVQSPMLAKGQEFRNVVLYKFGERCPDGFFDNSGDFEKRIAREYFLNKLYVAATRATHNLLIVETKAGAQFWRNALDSESTIYEFVRQSRDPDRWKGNVRGVIRGDSTTISAIAKDKVDPKELGQKLFENGLENRNSELLNQAAGYFQRGGDSKMAAKAQALSYQVRGEYLKAAQMFMQHGYEREVEECYWEGKCYRELFEWFANHKADDEQRKHIVQLMTLKNLDSAIRLLSYLHERLGDNRARFLRLSDGRLQEALREAYELAINKVNDVPHWQHFVGVLDELEGHHSQIGYRNVALVYYNAGCLEKAVRAWESLPNPSDREYFLAKATLTHNTADAIALYARINQHQGIVQRYEKHQGSELSPEVLMVVARSYEALGDFHKAIGVLERAEKYDEIMACCRRFLMQETETWGSVEDFEFLSGLVVRLTKRNRPDHSKGLLELLDERFTDELKERFASLVGNLLAYHCSQPQWRAALELVQLSKKFKKLNRENQTRLEFQLIEAIVNSEKPLEDKRELERFLATCSPTSTVELKMLGLAHEKTALDKDALAFYENVLNDDRLSDEERTHFRERWLEVKERQVQRLEREFGKNYPQTKRRRHELEEKRRQWKVYSDKVGYEIDPHSGVLVSQIEKAHPLVIEQDEANSTYVIRHQREVGMLTIDGMSGNVTAFQIKRPEQGPHPNGVEYIVKEWETSVVVEPGQLVRVYWNGQQVAHYVIGRV